MERDCKDVKGEICEEEECCNCERRSVGGEMGLGSDQQIFSRNAAP